MYVYCCYVEVHLVIGPIVMLVGPPGAGMTLMARAVPGILPSLSLE